jgi:SAM-dependent methyltransferase
VNGAGGGTGDGEHERLRDREREFFAGYYDDQKYNLTAWRLRMERELRSLLREAGPGGLGRVLSVGCGDGRFELMLAAHAEHVVGLDLSPEAIAIAERLAAERGVRNAEFLCVAAEDLVTDLTFDTVVCIAFLHHVPVDAFRPFVEQLAARLAPGGLLYTQDPNVHGTMRAIGRVVLGGSYDRYHSPDERELDPRELRDLLAGLAMEDVRVKGIDVTILPLGYLFPRGPHWPMHLCAWFDRLWCATPLERWASGFFAAARRPSGAPRP